VQIIIDEKGSLLTKPEGNTGNNKYSPGSIVLLLKRK
jgi:hypothetical protein